MNCQNTASHRSYKLLDKARLAESRYQLFGRNIPHTKYKDLKIFHLSLGRYKSGFVFERNETKKVLEPLAGRTIG